MASPTAAFLTLLPVQSTCNHHKNATSPRLPPRPTTLTASNTITTTTIKTPDAATLSLLHRPPAQPASDATILFLHDFMTDAHMFTPLFHTSPLQSHNLLAYDMRGYGRSSDPTGPYSHLNDIDTVLQSCASKHVHLVACGLGGVVALEYALTRRVSSVALFCSGLPGHRWSSMDYFLDITAARRVGHLLSVGGEYLNDQQQSDVDVLKWKRAFVSNNETWGERLRAKNSVSAALVAMAKAYRGYHFLNVDPQIDGPFDAEPLAKRLNQLSVPVFVGVGENDMPDFLQIADEIWQGVQRCAYADGVVRIEHAAHFPVLERPQVVADHLVSFWAAITTD